MNEEKKIPVDRKDTPVDKTFSDFQNVKNYFNNINNAHKIDNITLMSWNRIRGWHESRLIILIASNIFEKKIKKIFFDCKISIKGKPPLINCIVNDQIFIPESWSQKKKKIVAWIRKAIKKNVELHKYINNYKIMRDLRNEILHEDYLRNFNYNSSDIYEFFKSSNKFIDWLSTACEEFNEEHKHSNHS